MPTTKVNGVRLFYEESGTGDVALVLVHGAWTSHATWDRVARRLAASFRVITYDRRGHSQSERPDGADNIRVDVADLAALIEQLEIAPAWVAGSSAGAAIALRLAGERPDLLQGVIGHEPGFFSLLEDEPRFEPVLEKVDELNRAMVRRIGAGEHAGAAEQFIDTLLGTGAWEQIPRDFRQTLVENAPTVLEDLQDPQHFVFDLDWVRDFDKPVLLTYGDQSPPFFAPVVTRVGEALPQAQVVTIEGAGHTPYNTHPDVYVELITKFIHKHAA